MGAHESQITGQMWKLACHKQQDKCWGTCCHKQQDKRWGICLSQTTGQGLWNLPVTHILGQVWKVTKAQKTRHGISSVTNKTWLGGLNSETSIHHSCMHRFHARIVHLLWSLYIVHTHTFLTTMVSHIRLFFAVPSETMNRDFTVVKQQNKDWEAHNKTILQYAMVAIVTLAKDVPTI
jgi:hypothetical protein